MRFWETKNLAEMNREEWESLCDGCGKCCLHKLEDEDSGKIVFTRLACELLDLSNCRCRNYNERSRIVPDCVDLHQPGFNHFHWLPSTCAYRLLSEGNPLPEWHPLVTGNLESTQAAGKTISSFAIIANTEDDPEDYIIDWLR